MLGAPPTRRSFAFLPRRPLRVPRPSDWGIGMSLCIAAIARNKGIIAVSDMRFDLGYTSGDGLPKMGRLNRYWAAMFAGKNVSNAPRLLANIVQAVHGQEDVSRGQMEKLFRDEYRASLHEKIEAEILVPYKLTVSEFGRTGVSRFTPEIFGNIVGEMARVDLDYEFLVFGFDEKRTPHIFRVYSRGQIDDCGAFGFWAIGSGDTAAVHHMFFHEYNTGLPLRTAAYHACAAKYFAERASLGKRTYVVCLMKDGRLIGIDEARIRKFWKDNRPRIPEGVWDQLPPFVNVEGEVRPSDDVRPEAGTGLVRIYRAGGLS